jgi:anti-sigma factor RsiW
MARHPDGELVAYLQGELDPADRDRVAAHVDACGACRAQLAGFESVVRMLKRSWPEPPEVHWGRYRAELRTRLEASSGAPQRWGSGWWWRRPLPLALSAAMAGMLIVLALSGREGTVDVPVAFEESLTEGQLELLRTYPIVERLDLLENLEVIKQLDRLAPSRES